MDKSKRPKRKRVALPFRTMRPPKTVKRRGLDYFFWRGEMTMKATRRYAKAALARGFNVHLVRQRLLPGALIYTRPSVKESGYNPMIERDVRG